MCETKLVLTIQEFQKLYIQRHDATSLRKNKGKKSIIARVEVDEPSQRKSFRGRASGARIVLEPARNGGGVGC